MMHLCKKKIAIFSAAFFTVLLLASCASAPTMKKSRAGNVETVIATQGGKAVYKLVYTYEGNKIVKGEYWEPQKKDDKEAKDKTNIFSKNAIAKSFESMLAGSRVVDDSDIKLDKAEGGFVLKFVKKVRYNRGGLPVEERIRGYKKIPVLGFFNIKVDKKYSYDDRGHLIQLSEKNLNVDTLLLNFGIGNLTIITRDAMGRPNQVIKTIGSVPPTIELTTYTYVGNTSNMEKTVYEKAGIDLKKLKIVKEKRITFWYNKGIPWEGKKKYLFNMADSKNAVYGFLIYNLVENKNELDFSNFAKKSKMEQILLVKNLVMLYKNEMGGPSWRMGDLPDVPEPFMVYQDITWW